MLLQLFWWGGGWTLCEGLGKGPGGTRGSLPAGRAAQSSRGCTCCHCGLSQWESASKELCRKGRTGLGRDREGTGSSEEGETSGQCRKAGSPREVVPCAGAAPRGASTVWARGLPIPTPIPIPRHGQSRAEPPPEPLAQVGREWLRCGQAPSGAGGLPGWDTSISSAILPGAQGHPGFSVPPTLLLPDIHLLCRRDRCDSDSDSFGCLMPVLPACSGP